jgi:hypothetical protein
MPLQSAVRTKRRSEMDNGQGWTHQTCGVDPSTPCNTGVKKGDQLLHLQNDNPEHYNAREARL